MLGIEAGKIPSLRHREHRAENFAKTIFRCTVIVRDDKVNMQKCRDLDYRSIGILTIARSAFSCLAEPKNLVPAPYPFIELSMT
jgi:hypothetical protein